MVDWTEIKPKGKTGAYYDISGEQEEETVFKIFDNNLQLFITNTDGIENWRRKKGAKTFRLLIKQFVKDLYVQDFL